MKAAQAFIRELGGPAAVARRLKSPRRSGKSLTCAAVSKWQVIPPDHCPAIEAMSDGKARCEDLNPGVEWVRDRRGRITGYLVKVAA